MSDLAAVVVLAAGQGTRMKSALPKALHRVAGRSLLGHVLAATRPLGAGRTVVIVGHGRELMAGQVAQVAPYADTVVQEPQGGTGQAVRLALQSVPELTGDVLVVPADAPLLTTATLELLITRHRERGAAATLLTAILPDPTGYGRVLRGPDGDVRAIVEDGDADDETRAVVEAGVSVYVFDAERLREQLGRLSTDNVQGEEYLTDVIGLLVAAGAPVAAVTAPDWRETLGVNDRVQLADAGRLLRDRIAREWMLAGVTIVDPDTTWIDAEVRLAPDVTLLPNTRLHGRTEVAAGATVGPDSTLTDTTVAGEAQVVSSVCREAEIGPAATVGPFSYLRPGTRLGRGAKVGAFVETKSAVIGEDSKVPHLSYVGDATIGERTNIGAATVFVNFDGEAKHHTKVGDDVRVGSDSMLVAPVEIGDGAYTAAGSVISEDVPPGALGIGRARQRNVEGWVERRRPGSGSARAAARAARAGRTDGGSDGSGTGGGEADGGKTAADRTDEGPGAVR